MQVIYRWAFAVAPALCPLLPPTLKSGGARAPPEYMTPAPMLQNLQPVDSNRWYIIDSFKALQCFDLR